MSGPRYALTLAAVALWLPVLGAAAPARYTVVFQGGTVPPDAAAVVSAAGGTLAGTLPEVGVAIAVSANSQFAAAVRRSGKVYSAGPERWQALPADKVLAEPEAGPTSADIGYTNYGWDIRRVKADTAWSVTTGSHKTVVAIIDTGIAWNHPDLAPNVVLKACYSTQPACQPYPSLSYHATHVAGTVAAAFGGGRAVGVGPNLALASYNVFELMPDGTAGAYDGSIWAAMLDATARGYQVINMSLGGYVVKNQSQEDVAAWTAWNRVASYVTRKGVTVVSSAGNEAVNLNGPVAHVPSDLADVISVSAAGIRPNPVYPSAGAYDMLVDYSNYGAAVNLAAPGGDLGPDGTVYPYPAVYYMIYSTYVRLTPACSATASCTPSYAWAAGTSMASPHVAGAAGLVIDKYGTDSGLNPHQVTSILKQTAESIGSRQLFGAGMVNAAAAVGAR